LNIEAWVCRAVITWYMPGTTVHIAVTGGCALYMAPNFQYSAPRNVQLSPIAAQIRWVEYWSLNRRSCNYIVYVGDHSPHSVNWTICAVFGSKFECNARRFVDISPIAAQIPSFEYWSLNIRAVITLYMSGVTVHIAKTRGCRLCLAPRLLYNARSTVEISPIAAQIRKLEH
jgi:hypothetical protein